MTEYLTVSEHRPSPHYESGWTQVWGHVHNKLLCLGNFPEGREPAIGAVIQV